MQRLLGLLGLTCLVVLTACFYTNNSTAMILGAVCCVLFGVSLLIPKLRRNKTFPVMFLTSVLAVVFFLSYTYQVAEPLKRTYDNKKVHITATQLSEETYVNGYYTYELKVTTVNRKEDSFKMMLRSKHSFYTEPYDEISFPCELRANTNGSYASKGIFLQTYLFDEVDYSVKEPDSRPFMYHVIKLRSKLSMNLYMEMDYDTASFASAVFLGDDNSISPQLKGLLRTTGLSHIAVVSGLHLSIITLICRKIFHNLFGNRIVSGCFTILSILAFACLTGFGVSVQRSAFMLILLTIGTMVGRRADSLNSIGGAALLLLIINPYSVGDVGMLLSFAATLGIVLWSRKLTVPVKNRLYAIPFFNVKFVKWLVNIIVETVFCSLCATVWTLPITIIVFKGFSLVSLLANLLVVPLMTVVLFCIGGCVVTHYIEFLSVLEDTLSFVVSVFYDYLICVCSFLGNLPFAYIYTTQSYYYVWVVFSICLVIFAWIMRKRYIKILCIFLSLLFVLSCTVVYRIINRDVLYLHVIDTGYGQSVVLESIDGYAVLCAVGSRGKPYLLNNKVATMSAWGNDVLVDTGGYNSEEYCENLLNEFDYKQILRYHNTDVDLYTEHYSDKEVSFSGQHTLKLWNKAYVVLIPVNKYVVEYVYAGDKTMLIVPRWVDCEQIPKAYTSADYLVADGNLKSSELLRFNTLVVSDEKDVAEESILPLFSKATNIVTGSDINLKIKIN